MIFWLRITGLKGWEETKESVKIFIVGNNR